MTLQDDVLQIHKDVDRTFPESNYFFSNDKSSFTKGQYALYEVLMLFTKYDANVSEEKCGYVQGMNFIAGQLCYHASAEFAFYMFLKLMYKYSIIDNYREGLKGL